MGNKPSNSVSGNDNKPPQRVLANDNKQPTPSFVKDFPYDIRGIPLSQSSHFATNMSDENNQQLPQEQKNIIVGGGFGNNIITVKMVFMN